MNGLVGHFVLIVGAAAGLAMLALWSRRTIKIKILALTLTAAAFGSAYFGLTNLLSLPKPVALEWLQRDADDATVLASAVQEDVAIYLWLQLGRSVEPKYYQLPWNRDLAEALQKATRDAEAAQTEVRMRQPFLETSERMEQVFYAEPQKPAPQKQQHAASPQVYRRPSN